MPAPVLVAHDLSKAYGSRPILDGVSLALHPGERVALMGPSGSGKSTLLNCLGGLDRPDRGSVTLAGSDLASLSPEALARLRREACGTVFQFFHLLPTLTVAENIELPLQLLRWPAAQRRDRVGELLAAVGLTAFAKAFPDRLSGGEMQRVALARALAPRPRVLFADEPTGNLDTRAGEAVLQLLRDLAEQHQTALLVVTHSPSVLPICDRVLHLLDGRLVSAAEAAAHA